MLLDHPFASALNHLLDAEPWARQRLAPFGGETVALAAPPRAAKSLAKRAATTHQFRNENQGGGEWLVLKRFRSRR